MWAILAVRSRSRSRSSSTARAEEVASEPEADPGPDCFRCLSAPPAAAGPRRSPPSLPAPASPLLRRPTQPGRVRLEQATRVYQERLTYLAQSATWRGELLDRVGVAESSGRSGRGREARRLSRRSSPLLTGARSLSTCRDGDQEQQHGADLPEGQGHAPHPPPRRRRAAARARAARSTAAVERPPQPQPPTWTHAAPGQDLRGGIFVIFPVVPCRPSRPRRGATGARSSSCGWCRSATSSTSFLYRRWRRVPQGRPDGRQPGAERLRARTAYLVRPEDTTQAGSLMTGDECGAVEQQPLNKGRLDAARDPRRPRSSRPSSERYVVSPRRLRPRRSGCRPSEADQLRRLETADPHGPTTCWRRQDGRGGGRRFQVHAVPGHFPASIAYATDSIIFGRRALRRVGSAAPVEDSDWVRCSRSIGSLIDQLCTSFSSSPTFTTAQRRRRWSASGRATPSWRRYAG